jgi:hypothetical protein
MAYFETKKSNLGKFCRVLQWKKLVYFMAIWSILLPFGLFWYTLWTLGIDCCHLVYFMVIWYIFFRCFGMLWQEKSDNPGPMFSF